MQFKNLSYLPMAFIVAFVLSACAKTTYDGSPRIQPFANKMDRPPEPTQTEPTPTEPAPPEDPVPSEKLPVVSFVQSEVAMDSKYEAQLELQLSEASQKPVTIEVNLKDATAIHYRDFAGFKSHSLVKSKNNSAETSRVVVIPPGTTRMALPVIGGRHTWFCDGYFNAKISRNLQNAVVMADTARINVPCQAGDEPPVVVPTPEPDLCPQQVFARFETDRMVMKEHAKRATVKIILDRPASFPVTIDLETQDGSAFSQIDYVKVKTQLTIPTGQTSIELPIELFKNTRCRTADMRRWQQHANFEFHLLVTSIVNAEMLAPTMTIIHKKDVDDDNCPPTVN